MEVQIVVIILSILASAFFSGMEIAFVSANKMHIELEKKKEGFTAKVLAKLTLKSSKFITTMLVGNNIALVIYSFFMGEFMVQFLDLNPLLTLLTQTIISTIVILVTAEFLPKAIFRIFANESLKLFAIPAYFFYVLFHFLSEGITAISDFILRVFFNTKPAIEKTEFSKAELENYIVEQLEKVENKDVDSEIQMFQNAFFKLGSDCIVALL